MSHVSDGELHAYLDGALQELDSERAADVGSHLQLCSDCRARLEVARQIREHAGAILASVAPTSVEIPPFEEIETAAAARFEDKTGAGEPPTALASERPVPRRASWALGRMAGLAWAASVAFALAVGWQGRQLWSPARELQPGAVNERLQRPSPEGPEANARSIESGRGERAEAFKRDAAELSVAGAAEDRLAEGRDEASATEIAKAAEARSNDVAARDAGAGAAGEQQARAPGAPRDAPMTAELESPAEPRPDGDAFMGQMADASPEAWLSVNVDDAEHWLEAPVLSVPDVAVEEIAISFQAGTRVVRVRQRLDSGVLVELVEIRGPSDARMRELQTVDGVRAEEEAEEPRSAEWADPEAVLRGAVTTPDEADELKNTLAAVSEWRDGVLVTVQAPLALDSLRSLLSRLR